MNTLLSLIIHYVYGLFSESWNGAVAMIVVLVKDTAEGKPGALSWVNIWHAFLTGLSVNAILYLYAHKLPAALPPGVADTPMARLRQAVNPAAVLVPSGPSSALAPPAANREINLTPAAVGLIALALLFLGSGLGGCVNTASQTAPDVNYWSYSGDDSGSLFLTNPANPSGLQLRSGPLPVYVIPGLTIILNDSSGYNDVLKFSHAVNILFDGGPSGSAVTVYTGGNQKEQAIDMNNHCSNITFRGAVNLQEGAQNAWTIKGGCHGIHADTVTISPGSGNCDVELGGISAQVPAEKITDVTITNLLRTDGKPAQVRVWTSRADNPIITSGNAVITDLNL